jgi:hypothetical protein
MLSRAQKCGEIDLRVIPWNQARRGGWGIQIDFPSGGCYKKYVGSEREAEQALLVESKRLDEQNQ